MGTPGEKTASQIFAGQRWAGNNRAIASRTARCAELTRAQLGVILEFEARAQLALIPGVMLEFESRAQLALIPGVMLEFESRAQPAPIQHCARIAKAQLGVMLRLSREEPALIQLRGSRGCVKQPLPQKLAGLDRSASKSKRANSYVGSPISPELVLPNSALDIKEGRNERRSSKATSRIWERLSSSLAKQRESASLCN